MTLSFFIPKRLPALNEMIEKKAKAHWSKYHALKEQAINDICLVLRKAPAKDDHGIRRHKRRFSGPVHFLFTWYEPNKKRDPDNIAAGKKFILDALQREGLISSDSWKNMAGWNDKFVVDKKNPGVHVVMVERP